MEHRGPDPRKPESRTVTMADIKLKQEIEDDLRWNPRVHENRIGVRVDHGRVSLVGEVDTYLEKWAAEETVRRVGDVHPAGEALIVSLAQGQLQLDRQIAEAALNALKWDVWGLEGVTVEVHRGQVTLGGQVHWNFERQSAERAIRPLPGVVGVTNSIRIRSLSPAGPRVRATRRDRVRPALVQA